MLIITTGISGCGRKEYLENFLNYSKKYKKKIKIYHVGQMLFEQAAKIGVYLSRENILNANPTVISAIRSAVYEKIYAQLPQELKENDAVILNIHSIFFWKKVFTRAWDPFYISKFEPDLFISFIDDAGLIKERLSARRQWAETNLTTEEILLWQNVEVEMTASWTEITNKPFYVIAVKQPVFTFYRLVFEPQAETVYVSMPMTHLKTEKERKMVDSFVKELNKYFIVFDPRTVEIEAKNQKKAIFDLATYHQTVNRDLHWLIKQSKKVIAYFPKVVSSPGVINELREAHETNKIVWLIYPAKVVSPFITYYCNQIFDNREKFFNFLKKHYQPLRSS